MRLTLADYLVGSGDIDGIKLKFRFGICSVELCGRSICEDV